jgi:hypothetical protein
MRRKITKRIKMNSPSNARQFTNLSTLRSDKLSVVFDSVSAKTLNSLIRRGTKKNMKGFVRKKRGQRLISRRLRRNF